MAIYNGINKVIPSGIDKIYVGNDLVYEATSPLCFTSSGESTIQLKITAALTNSVDIYYSYDNSAWTSWLSGTSGSSSTITLSDGDKFYVWNKNSTLNDFSGYVGFIMTGSLAASGNVNSMINYGELTTYCYADLFSYCAVLTSAPELPATTLASYCYYCMFQNCTSLTTAPELPATTLKDYCYYCMFQNCTNLKVNENGTSGTKIFTCPSTTSLTEPVTNMFQDTGGSFTGTPTAGNTYKYY